MNIEEQGGEPYDYEDTPRYWMERDLEQKIINEEIEEYGRYKED